MLFIGLLSEENDRTQYGRVQKHVACLYLGVLTFLIKTRKLYCYSDVVLSVLSTANADYTAKLWECITPHAETLDGHMEAIPSWPKHKTEEVCR